MEKILTEVEAEREPSEKSTLSTRLLEIEKELENIGHMPSSRYERAKNAYVSFSMNVHDKEDVLEAESKGLSKWIKGNIFLVIMGCMSLFLLGFVLELFVEPSSMQKFVLDLIKVVSGISFGLVLGSRK